MSEQLHFAIPLYIFKNRQASMVTLSIQMIYRCSFLLEKNRHDVKR